MDTLLTPLSVLVLLQTVLNNQQLFTYNLELTALIQRQFDSFPKVFIQTLPFL